MIQWTFFKMICDYISLIRWWMEVCTHRSVNSQSNPNVLKPVASSVSRGHGIRGQDDLNIYSPWTVQLNSKMETRTKHLLAVILLWCAWFSGGSLRLLNSTFTWTSTPRSRATFSRMSCSWRIPLHTNMTVFSLMQRNKLKYTLYFRLFRTFYFLLTQSQFSKKHCKEMAKESVVCNVMLALPINNGL